MEDEKAHVVPQLAGYLDGSLSDTDHAYVEAHLKVCEACEHEHQERLKADPAPPENTPAASFPINFTLISPDPPSNHPVESTSTETPSELPPDNAENPALDPPPGPLPGDIVNQEVGALSELGQGLKGPMRKLAIGLTVLCVVIFGLWLVSKMLGHKPVKTITPVSPTVPVASLSQITPAPTSSVPTVSTTTSVVSKAMSDIEGLNAFMDSIPVIPASTAIKKPSHAAPPVTKTSTRSSPVYETDVEAPKNVVPPDVSSKFFIGTSGLPEWKGSSSGIKNFRTVAIRNERAWRTLWREHSGSETRVPPEMDFDQYMVVGVFAGPKPKGASVEILSTEEALPSSLIIYFRETSAASDAGSESVTHPYHLWVIIKTSLDVTFQRRD